MDYVGLASQAIAILRQTRTLWLFAILIALVEPSFALGGSPSFNFDFNIFDFNIAPRTPADEGAVVRTLILALIPVLFILGLWIIATFFVAPLARGGIVWSAWRGAAGEDPPLSDVFRAAQARYGPLLIIQALTLIVPVALALVGAIVASPAIGLIALLGGTREPPLGVVVLGIAALIVVLLVILVAVVFLFIAGAIVLQSLVTLASIEVMVAGSGAGAALRTAWQLITRHLGPIAVIALLFAVLNGIIGALAALPVTAILFVPLALAPGGTPPFGLLFAAILILALLTALFQTPVQALRYTYFTLLHREWTAREEAGVISR
ncbi:MAG: hypothetical protein RMM58_02405 [Chloroflexota bacterium]|nr:hypothetical protein [Dehalococcoidia bacterium]MDW8252709.1 hypothetical protein [Chloroflexota bacterium]